MQKKKMPFPKVYILVLNYNGKETLLNCLRSVYQLDYQNFETVIIDNNSDDGSFELAKQNFSTAHFIKNHSNLGFAAGNNVGIRFALEKFADYVLLLNSDAYLKKDALTKLIEETEKVPGFDIASPLITRADEKTIWFAGGKINWLRMRTTHLFDAYSSQPSSSEYITGCAMLVKKQVFKKIGLFDEDFFLYYEDADFSLRAKKNGFSLGIIPAAKITHDERSEQTRSKKIYWLVLSGLIFYKKHLPFYLKPWFFLHLFLRRCKNMLILFFTKTEIALQVRRAYRDFDKF